MSTATALPLHDREPLAALPVEHLCDFSVDLAPAQVIHSPVGLRMTFIVRQGTVSGPRLQGRLLPGGGDWLLVGSDGVGRVDVRATIETHDGALIHYETRGVIIIPSDGLERLAAGERLPFEATYVRTTPRLETSDERYAWLTRDVLVSHNELSQDHIDYRIYRVL